MFGNLTDVRSVGSVFYWWKKIGLSVLNKLFYSETTIVGTEII